MTSQKMKYGLQYNLTYAPVAFWNSIQVMLSMVVRYRWYTKQIDYVFAFPQAPFERELYLKIPKGFEVDGGNTKDYVLKVKRNIYGQKQAGRVWNKYLVDKLINQVGFKQSKVDKCVFYKGSTMYVLYTDDSILAGPNKQVSRKQNLTSPLKETCKIFLELTLTKSQTEIFTSRNRT